MNINKLATYIIEKVGTVSNIKSLAHCMTRLRVSVKDQSKVDEKALSKLDGVIDVVKVGDQFQIVLGGIVDDVFQETAKQANIEEDGKSFINEKLDDLPIEPKNQEKPRSFWKRFGEGISHCVTTLSAIFTPLIPAMLGAGLLKVVLIIANKFFGIGSTNSTYALLDILQNSFFYYMPILVGWSAAKRFKANTILSLMMIGLLIHPNLAMLFDKGAVTFLGIHVTKITYTSSIIPAILCVYLLSKVEAWLRKILPPMLRSILLPLLTLLIVAPVTLIVLGPLGYWGGLLMTNIVTSFYNFSPILSGALIGGTWNILLITGMHMVLLGLVRNPNIATYGVDHVLVAYAASLMCQVSAGLAVAIRTKDPILKEKAFSLSLTSFFAGNVIEPVMYGINIKYKKPFYFTIVGGAIGGAIIGASGAGIYAPTAFSIYTLPAYMGPGFGGLIIGSLVGAAITFVLTYRYGLDEDTINGTGNASNDDTQNPEYI